MNKDDILKEFDTLAEAKRKGAVNLKLCLGFALLVVVLVLAWGLAVNFSALDKVVVVERSGEYLKTTAEDAEDLFIALVKNTCAEATRYANSFDRLNMKRNQAHAAFYVNKNDLNAVFSKYYNDKAYFDAAQNGAVYKCELESVDKISGDNEPYQVEFTSVLTVYGVSGQKVKFLIRTKGELVRTTPQYPENVTGFFFTQFLQQLVRIEQQNKSEPMDKTTKTKIIVFASFGIFVLVVLAVVLALGGSDEEEDLQSVNTSLRAQQQSDFTIDDMMNSEATPEYENFSDEVYRERAEGIYTEDPEVLALQEQLRANQRADSLAKVAPKPRTVKKKPEKPKAEPKPEKAAPVSRFFSGDKPKNTGNTIEAIVSGDQKLTSGSVIKLVTLQEMQTPGGLQLDKGTALFGLVRLEQDRINISIESVRVGNSIYELKKTVYDQDGLPGIYVPLNIKAEASKEAADEVVGDLNTGIYGTDMLSTGVNAVSNAAKSVFRKKNNQIVVTVKSNYKLYLK